MLDPASPSRQTWRRIGIFLALVAALSGGLDLLIIRSGSLGAAMGLYTLGLMWTPGVAALLACRLTGTPLAALGWQWPAWREVVLAWLLPVGYAGVAYAAIWLGGWGGVPDPERVAGLARSMDLEGCPAAVVIGAHVLVFGTLGVVRAMTGAVGEEIGWRGFLVPQLARVMRLPGVVLVSGAAWLVFHVPVLILADYNAGTPRWFALACFAVIISGVSAVMATARLRTGSLWPAALLHASHNLFVQGVFTPLTSDTGPTEWLVDEFGLGLAVTVGALGAWTMWRARGRPARTATTPA